MDPFRTSDIDAGFGELCENTENDGKRQTRGRRGARGRKKKESIQDEVLKLLSSENFCVTPSTEKVENLDNEAKKPVRNSKNVEIEDQCKKRIGNSTEQASAVNATPKERKRLDKLAKKMEDYCKNGVTDNHHEKKNGNSKMKKNLGKIGKEKEKISKFESQMDQINKYFDNGESDDNYEMENYKEWIKEWDRQSKLRPLTRSDVIRLWCATFRIPQKDDNIPIKSKSQINEEKTYFESKKKVEEKKKYPGNLNLPKFSKKSTQAEAHYSFNTNKKKSKKLKDMLAKERKDQLGVKTGEKKRSSSQKHVIEKTRKNKLEVDYSTENEICAMELTPHEHKNKKSKPDLTFARHVRKRDALKLLECQNPEEPFIVKGYIRINPKNYNQSFVSIDNGSDIRITDSRSRNRAMEKDLVVVKINPSEEWWNLEDEGLQKTGSVICILEKNHSRKVVGTLKFEKDRFKLKSRDNTVPNVVIDSRSIPSEILLSPKSMANTLFLAKIENWLNPFSCRGTIECIVGNVGDLENETSAILLAKGLDVTPYDDELTKELPDEDYLIVDSDLDGREDWRDECVFTIDPATAVDLDDAVSCKKLPNGNYEIGVHISDVTHYLKAFSPLDEEVSKRATTVYLVNTVYHMLPKSLCKLCSLLPGKEKLSFSVIWEMTPEATVVKHRFAKTIIKSSYQMSYEQAQLMIDQSSRVWSRDDLPNLVGKHSASEISEIVNILYKLSSQMRERRFADGALSINQPKLQIILDKETGSYPVSFRIEERQDSNRLIEEFMLLANMTVAKHLYENMSDSAFLRIHEEPLLRVLSQTARDLSHLGVHLNIDSAGGLNSSMSFYEKSGLEGYYNEFATNCRMMVINALCAQSMPRAKYTCSGTVTDKEQLRHFALNVPFYTHFTSPIRRYADCVVHRLLFASMTNSPLPDKWSANLCAKIAANCNAKKYSAKIAQEESNELYFVDLLSRNGPTETMAVVMRVKQRSMDVILCYVGITVTVVYTDFKKDAQIEYNNEHSVSTLVVKWNDTEITQTINVFSLVTLRIEKHPKKYSIRGTLLPTRSIENSSHT